jgi:hypothetical protein
MQVQYGTALAGGPFASLTFTEPAGTATNCFVTTPSAASPAQQQLTCNTLPGAGRNLAWQVVVDGQVSTTPTTSYAAPVVASITSPVGAAVTAANVSGGDIVWITGQFYGPFYANKSLVQKVLYGPTGTELTLSAARWSAATATAQTRITAVLPPGSGPGRKA